MNGTGETSVGGDRFPTGPRASDEDRKRYVSRLQDAAGDGLIDLDELGERITRVYDAKTVGELELVTEDLPAVPTARAASTPKKYSAMDSPSFRAHLTMYVLVIGFLIGIWLMTGAGFFWPFFPAAGWGIGIGGHWQAADHVARKKNRGEELSAKDCKTWDDDDREDRNRARAARRDERREGGRHHRHRAEERSRADRLREDARERADNVAEQAARRARDAAERAARAGTEAADRALPSPPAVPPIPTMPGRPEPASASGTGAETVSPTPTPSAEPSRSASPDPGIGTNPATDPIPATVASGVGSTAPPPRPADTPSRRFVAAAFVDIVGSTSLNEALGDDGYARVRSRFRSLVEDCASTEGGVEVNTMGDGVLVRFDHPSHAARAAVEIMRRLDAQRGETGFAPSVRIGIHSGDAVEDEGDIIGRVVNLAARVTGAAGQDEIWCTEHVADHVTSSARPVGRGLHTLKGMAQPRHLLSIDWR